MEKALFGFSFDDGRIDQFTIAYPILKKYGLPATFNITASYIEGRPSEWPFTEVAPMTLDMLRQLHADPQMEIASHGYWHHNAPDNLLHGVHTLCEILQTDHLYKNSNGIALTGNTVFTTDEDILLAKAKDLKIPVQYIRHSIRRPSFPWLKISARKINRLIPSPALFRFALSDSLMSDYHLEDPSAASPRRSDGPSAASSLRFDDPSTASSSPSSPSCPHRPSRLSEALSDGPSAASSPRPFLPSRPHRPSRPLGEPINHPSLSPDCPSEFPSDHPSTLHRLYSIPIVANKPLFDMQALIEKAIQTRTACIFMMHSIVPDDHRHDLYEMEQSRFDALCSYLAQCQSASRLQVATSMDIHQSLLGSTPHHP